MKRFGDWVLMREVGEPVGMPTGRTGSGLSPEKQKVLDDIKNALIGGKRTSLVRSDLGDIYKGETGLLTTGGLFHQADKLLRFIIRSTEPIKQVRETNDPQVIQFYVNQYYRELDQRAKDTVSFMKFQNDNHLRKFQGKDVLPADDAKVATDKTLAEMQKNINNLALTVELLRSFEDISIELLKLIHNNPNPYFDRSSDSYLPVVSKIMNNISYNRDLK